MRKQTKDIELYLRLLGYVKPYWRMFIISVIAMVVLAITEPAIAALMKPMLDGGFIEKDPEIIALVPVLFVVLFAVRGIADFSSSVALSWVANKVIMDLRGDMFMQLLTLPSRYYDQHVTGRLISRFAYDVSQVKSATTNAITVVIRDSLTIVGLLAWMFYLNWQLSLISLLCAPFIAGLVLLIRQRLRKMGRKVQATMGDISHVLSECIHNHKLIKLFGGSEQEGRRFFEVNNNNRRYMMKFAIASAATGPGIQFIAAVATAAIVYIATRQAISGSLTVGEFISFIAAMSMLLTPLKRLVRINEFIQKGLAASESIFDLLDQETEIDKGGKQVERLRGEIELDNVSFRYDPEHSAALNRITLTVRPGETVALVGSSGSGKTTIANLLPAFYQVNEGAIRLDGVDVRDYSLATLRANIAFVSQEVMLFNDTVRNNIAYGALADSSDDAVDKAAEAANAMEFIRDLPRGMDTNIGEKGQRLSGGQRQRLAIARALLKDAPVLILDEATSSLDTESERSIQEALDNIRKNRTCIIIAHRLSTVENADRIVVIDQGRIVQSGTHKQLLQQDGVYARLHQVQLSSANSN
ncbi:MAG TPA: lipid A export permease/ATP-binding protein MsbA [Gammaproteobacteria bacterium]|nr:lipid A export permease/ATP-binding protein MsbA [Gammaproteobacteria bacterium]